MLRVALAVKPLDEALLRARIGVAARERDIPALRSAYRSLVAACPDDEDALENAAALELAGGDVDVARKLLAQSMRGSRMRLATESTIDEARARSDGAYVAVLDEVDVETHDWAILDGGRLYNAEAHARTLSKSPYVKGRASPDQRSFLFRLPPVTRVIEQPCVHLGGDLNYAHWIERNLLKLSLLEGTPYEGLPLLVPEGLQPFQRDYLEKLGIGEERLLEVPRPALVHCRRLVVPTNLVYSEKIGVGIDWLRRRLSPWMDPGPPRDLLFLSREGVRVRRLVNEPALTGALTALGFSVINTAVMTIEDQIRAMSRASVIVGAHGAAFANLVFAPPGAAVIEINSTYKSRVLDFEHLAKHAGLDFERVLSEDYDFTREEPYLEDTDFNVDVEEVLSALRRLRPEIFGARDQSLTPVASSQ